MLFALVNRQRAMAAKRQKKGQAAPILLVCSAMKAARVPDQCILQQVRDHFIAQPDPPPPPILVAMTHTDQLRAFLVQELPYDIVTPYTLRPALSAPRLMRLHRTFQIVKVVQIIQVCVHPEPLYNIDVALMPALRREVLQKAVSTVVHEIRGGNTGNGEESS